MYKEKKKNCIYTHNKQVKEEFGKTKYRHRMENTSECFGAAGYRAGRAVMTGLQIF